MADDQEVPVEQPAPAADESPEEATKRRFREALERKNGHASQGGSYHNGGKVRGAHNQAGGKRTFRRRAGG